MPPSKSPLKRTAVLLGCCCWSLLVSNGSQAQQVRFPTNNLAQSASNPWNPSVYPGNPVIPPSNSNLAWPSPSGSAGTAFGAPTVTPIGPPYGSGGIGATIRPNSAPLLPPTSGNYPPTANSWNLGNWFGTNSGYNQPLPLGAPSGVNPTLPNMYPSSVYPNANPPTLFPNGYAPNLNPYGAVATQPYGGVYPSNGTQGSLFSSSLFNSNNWRLGNGWFNGNMNGPLMNGQMPMTSRFFVAPRFRHSWIAGDDQPGDVQPNSLGVNDSDVSLLFQIPRFLGSTQPLYIAPSFSIHLWDGPKHPIADLPGSAYSAFLDFGWETDPLRTFGLELGVRVGVFSDFNALTGDSLRILGKVLGRVRLTPTATARLGAFWIDRNRIKLIPAGGILWVPNADTRFDLFFPEPKLSHYLATLGNTDMWWYASGYYGGGTWTIERTSGMEDSIDLNDMRIVMGLEWGRNESLRQGHRFAFFEGGYAFNRELLYRYRPQDSIDIEDSFILRAGIIY